MRNEYGTTNDYGDYFCAVCVKSSRVPSGEGVKWSAITLGDLRQDKEQREAETAAFAPPRLCDGCGAEFDPIELYPR